MRMTKDEELDRLEYEMNDLWRLRNNHAPGNDMRNKINDAIIECQFEYKTITGGFYNIPQLQIYRNI